MRIPWLSRSKQKSLRTPGFIHLGVALFQQTRSRFRLRMMRVTRAYHPRRRTESWSRDIRQQGIVIWIALQQVPGIESTRAPDEVQLTCSLHTHALLPRPCSSFPISLSPPPHPLCLSFSFSSSTFFSYSSCPLEKARFVSPQRALLQVPDWLLNWHSLKYPSNACREWYVWVKKGSPSQSQ